MSTDAIVMLKQDHAQMRKAFTRFEKAKGDTPEAVAERGEIVEEIIQLLTVHTHIENEVMYPRVREQLPELEDDVLESYEEHHVADLIVAELAALQPDDERFVAKTTVLMENVRHHMEEEEQEWFPQVRSGLGRKALQEIGAAMAEARDSTPTGPTQSAGAAEGDEGDEGDETAGGTGGSGGSGGEADAE